MSIFLEPHLMRDSAPPAKRRAEESDPTDSSSNVSKRLWALSASMVADSARPLLLNSEPHVAHRLIDDADEVLGLPRTHEETRCTLMGGARVVYRSWTKAKDATRVFHSALLTVNGMLCAKLSWQWMDDDREAAVLEVYRVPLWTLARRVGMAVDAFAVLQFLAAFCIHYGPKGERYSLQDFSSALDAPSLGPTGPRSVVRTFESPRSSDRTLGLDVARIASDDVHCPDSPHAAPEE